MGGVCEGGVGRGGRERMIFIHFLKTTRKLKFNRFHNTDRVPIRCQAPLGGLRRKECERNALGAPALIKGNRGAACGSWVTAPSSQDLQQLSTRYVSAIFR